MSDQTISLSKSEKISLKKTAPGILVARFGLSWTGGKPRVAAASVPPQTPASQPTKPRGLFGRIADAFAGMVETVGNTELGAEIIDDLAPSYASSVDLDASAVLLDADASPIETIYFGRRHSTNGSVYHHGDDLTGRDSKGIDDNETIDVKLTELNPNVKYVVFTVNSFSNIPFNRVGWARVRLIDAKTGTPKAEYTFSQSDSRTALVMSALVRRESDWEFHAIGELTSGRVVGDMMSEIIKHVRRIPT